MANLEQQHNLVAYLEIDGKTFYVSSFEASHAENGIPTISIQCAPSSEDLSNYGVFTPGRAVQINEELKKLRWREDVDLEFNYVDYFPSGVDEADDEFKFYRDESITVKKWVIVDSGISAVSSSQPPVLNVVLQHPACLLRKVRLSMSTEYATVKNVKDDDSKNVLESIIYGMTRYLDAHDPDKVDPERGVLVDASGDKLTLVAEDRKRVANVREKLEKINDYVVLDENADPEITYPFPDEANFTDFMKKYLAHTSLYGDMSIFDGIVRLITPMFLSVTGGFNDDPLAIVYRSPWPETLNGGAAYKDVSDLSLPTVSEPMSGLVILGKDHFGALLGFTGNDVIDMKKAVSRARSDVLAANLDWIDDLQGEVLYTGAPGWMIDYQLHSRGRPKGGKRKTTFTAEQIRKYKEATKAQQERYKKLLDRYVDDAFFDRFMANDRCSVTAIVGHQFQAGGGRGWDPRWPSVQPTDVVEVFDYDDPTGPGRLAMYVTHVNRRVSFPDRAAYMTVVGSHLRSANDGVQTGVQLSLFDLSSFGQKTTIVKDRKLSVWNKPEE